MDKENNSSPPSKRRKCDDEIASENYEDNSDYWPDSDSDGGN